MKMRTKSNKAKAAMKKNGHSKMSLETLEPRLLLSGDGVDPNANLIPANSSTQVNQQMLAPAPGGAGTMAAAASVTTPVDVDLAFSTNNTLKIDLTKFNRPAAKKVTRTFAITGVDCVLGARDADGLMSITKGGQNAGALFAKTNLASSGAFVLIPGLNVSNFKLNIHETDVDKTNSASPVTTTFDYKLNLAQVNGAQTQADKLKN